MIDLFDAGNALMLLVGLGTLAVKVWALADAGTRPTAAFPAAGKLTKPAWLGILVAAVVLGFLFGPLGIFGLVGLIAAIVYLVDVRPAVREMRPGGPWG